MSNELITKENNERIKSFFSSLEWLSVAMEKLFASRKPSLNGEHFIPTANWQKTKAQSQKSTGLSQRGAHSVHQIRR